MTPERCGPSCPLYMSSVDSGNLAGHLLTLGSGLREQAEEKIFTPQVFAGLRDTVGVLRDLAPRKRRAGEARRRIGASASESARGVCLAGNGGGTGGGNRCVRWRRRRKNSKAGPNL